MRITMEELLAGLTKKQRLAVDLSIYPATSDFLKNDVRFYAPENVIQSYIMHTPALSALPASAFPFDYYTTLDILPPLWHYGYKFKPEDAIRLRTANAPVDEPPESFESFKAQTQAFDPAITDVEAKEMYEEEAIKWVQRRVRTITGDDLRVRLPVLEVWEDGEKVMVISLRNSWNLISPPEKSLFRAAGRFLFGDDFDEAPKWYIDCTYFCWYGNVSKTEYPIYA